jgi:hypothetical protein
MLTRIQCSATRSKYNNSGGKSKKSTIKATWIQMINNNKICKY